VEDPSLQRDAASGAAVSGAQATASGGTSVSADPAGAGAPSNLGSPSGSQESLSLRVVNQSSSFGSACVYQAAPSIGPSESFPLTWFAAFMPPGTERTFLWTETFAFTWSETGPLVPGSIFSAAQTWGADLGSGSEVTFTQSGGQYTFAGLTQGGEPGSLEILADASIPSGPASLGIAMSGTPTLAWPAQPNVVFSVVPRPSYWLFFGDCQVGQVLDPNTLTSAVQVDFPAGLTGVTATLDVAGAWIVVPN
jgi:hypothetical protein